MKKTGAASVASVIALHGFKMEVLAGASYCPYWDVPVGFTSQRTKTLVCLDSASQGVEVAEAAMNQVNTYFDPSNTSQELEDAAATWNGANVPLMESACNGLVTYLDPATVTVIGPSWLPPVRDAGGDWTISGTILYTRRNAQGKTCP
jgi:hypothetical protein